MSNQSSCTGCGAVCKDACASCEGECGATCNDHTVAEDPSIPHIELTNPYENMLGLKRE